MQEKIHKYSDCKYHELSIMISEREKNMRGQISIFEEDINKVIDADFIDWGILNNKTIFITGATGLIGSSVIRSLDQVNLRYSLNITVIALVRDEERARKRFADILDNGMLTVLVGTVENPPIVEGNVDYILHAASQTASKEFVQHAVETIETSILGTFNMLRLAKSKAVRGFVYLSSMEVYGYPERGHKVTENEIGSLNPLELRNSYPISKMMSEAMCCAYAKEYGVPAMICRLTQTFGPGVNYNDTRIFAYFGRCVSEKKNIVLKTKGETERCYLYTTDAVTAILLIMLKGDPGKAYNAADEDTYCSIAEMAEYVAADAGIKVEYEIQDLKENGFPQTLYMNLDTTALKQLGWRPRGGIR